MPKGRPCTACADEKLAKAVTRMLAEGVSQAEIARRLEIGAMSLSRHIRGHVAPVMRAITKAIEGDSPAREQRRQLIEAAENGDLQPEQYLTLSAIVNSLKTAAARIERASQTAEGAGQMTAVAALSGQAIRAVETRARLGSVGGFAPPKHRETDGGVPFTLTMVFSNRTERFELANAGPQEIEAIDHVPAGAAPRAMSYDMRPDHEVARLPAFLPEGEASEDEDA